MTTFILAYQRVGKIKGTDARCRRQFDKTVLPPAVSHRQRVYWFMLDNIKRTEPPVDFIFTLNNAIAY
ncbi:hypothetical protein DID88_006221 [Monilinia fructigena]|uniref:Uncharacterized protein n=1 Tax=Monilinia fructigena TaxID=38457 RepID=A0A395J2F6_9HELO|nr:hypothetical protein DID88_006221 [Monilinia fructigena]